MVVSAGIIILAILMTRYWLRPPPSLRGIAWANLFVYAITAFVFSRLTGSASHGVDALKYFNRGEELDVTTLDSYLQANFVYYLSSQLQRLLPLDYLSFNMIGALLFSYLGMLLVMRQCPNPTKQQKLFWWFITLMPAYHFWTAPFGKDSIQLVLIGVFFSSQKLRWKGVSLVGLLLVRPHIALALGFAEVMSNMFRRGVTKRKIAFLSMGVAVMAYAGIFLLERLGGQLNITDVLRLFTEYGDEWRSGSLRNSNTSTPFAILEFLFRPYFWEVNNIPTLMGSMDSLLAGMAVVFVLIKTPRRYKLHAPWLFMVLTILLLAFTNPNVGTAVRKKQLVIFVALIVVATSSRRRRTVFDQPPIGQATSASHA